MKTAVEWLVHVVQSNIAPNYIPKEIVQQAIEMEKQQIIDTYIGCKREYIVGIDCYPPQFVSTEAEQYYQKTYKSE